MSYLLMHKNTKVAEIDIIDGDIKVNKVLNENWMPHGTKNVSLAILNSEIKNWNNSRCIPFERANVFFFMENNNIKTEADMIAKSYLCSLTDCYWFKEQNDPKTWEDVNFNQNGFSSDLYRALFYGKQIDEPDWHSPDLTTNGNTDKMWLEKDGTYYLRKKDSIEFKYQAMCEFVASELMDAMEIDHAKYQFENAHICLSEIFIKSDGEEFVPFKALYTDIGDEGEYDDLMARFGLENDYYNMILVDCLMQNTDRHMFNYGVIVDSNTNNVLRFAPIFDTGAGNLLEDIGYVEHGATGLSFNETLALLPLETLQLVDKIKLENIQRISQKVQEMLGEKVGLIVEDAIISRVNNIKMLIEQRLHNLENQSIKERQENEEYEEYEESLDIDGREF